MTDPVPAAEFAALMARVEPFEAPPRLAVGVSGGVDSMALCLLLDRWARDRGGTVTALTVDHGLRPESATESTTVGAWLRARGIAHAILNWAGPKPRHGVQAAAREARHRLLGEWCRGAGVLHLALAHNREDQAETFLLRLGRGSGVVGLSAMSPVSFRAFGRLLRPLLDVPRARLEATATAFGQSWIEDPSNRDPAFARVRVRGTLLPALESGGITGGRVVETTFRLGRARAVLEEATAAMLAGTVRVDPTGYALIDLPGFLAAPEDIGLRALARLIAAIGGGAYPPRHERLARLYGAMADGGGRGWTLGGCRIRPYREGILLCREPAAVTEVVPATPSGRIFWDRRFVVETGNGLPEGATIAALGAKGWARIADSLDRRARGQLPHDVRATLPALFCAEVVLAVPHLGYSRSWMGVGAVAFAPGVPVASVGWPLVSRPLFRGGRGAI